MRLIINEYKTKYIFITKKWTVMQNFSMGSNSFELVENFKYLGDNTNQRNNMYNELGLRLISTNRGYHTMRSILSLRLHSREIKETPCISYVCSIVMYACTTWATMKGNEQKLLVFEKNIWSHIKLGIKKLRKKKK